MILNAHKEHKISRDLSVKTETDYLILNVKTETKNLYLNVETQIIDLDHYESL